jgi:hypothetical protein
LKLQIPSSYHKYFISFRNTEFLKSTHNPTLLIKFGNKQLYMDGISNAKLELKIIKFIISNLYFEM